MEVSALNLSQLVDRARQRSPLPPGTTSVGVGLIVAGVSAYAFLAISSRALGPSRYTPLALLWALVFVVGPGFFLPLEQELGRALSARRVRGEGGAPLIRRAGLAGATFTTILVLLAVTVGRTRLDHVFGDRPLLVGAFMLGLVAYYAEFLLRGTYSGNGRFAPYGTILALEGLLRAGAVVVLAVLGVTEVGAYGFVIGGGTLIALAISLRGQRGLATPGPQAPWSELSNNIVTLVLASVLAQFLVNAAPLSMQALAKPGEAAEPGIILNALVIARTPLFFFQAIQAALLPRLAALAAAGRFAEFRHGMSRLILLLAAVGAAATVGFAALGPFAVRLLFGHDFIVTHTDMALLALASAIYMLALAQAQALIAIDDHLHTVIGWACGVSMFVALLTIEAPLRLRAERALLGATVTAAVVMGVLLARQIRGGAPVEQVVSPEELLAIATEP